MGLFISRRWGRWIMRVFNMVGISIIFLLVLVLGCQEPAVHKSAASAEQSVYNSGYEDGVRDTKSIAGLAKSSETTPAGIMPKPGLPDRTIIPSIPSTPGSSSLTGNFQSHLSKESAPQDPGYQTPTPRVSHPWNRTYQCISCYQWRQSIK